MCWQLDVTHSFAGFDKSLKLDDNQGSVNPIDEPKIFFHYWRRQRKLTYALPLVVNEPTSSLERVEKEEPAPIIEIKVRDIEIPCTTNFLSCIHKPELGGRLNWSRVWCNYCTLMDNSFVCRTRMQLFTITIFLRSVTRIVKLEWLWNM